MLAFPRVSVTPGIPLHFFAILLPKQHSFFKIGRLFSLSLFSCPSLARLRLLILLLLLMSGKASQPWPHLFLLSVYWKCHLAGQVSAMLYLLQIDPPKVLTTFPLQIQNSWQLSLLELPPCCVCVPTRNTVTLSSDSSGMYTFTVQSGPPSANAELPPHPSLQTSYPLAAHFVSSSSAPYHCPLLLAVLPRLLSPLTLSGSSMECWRSSSQEH